MQATLNMAKLLIVVSKGTSPGAGALSSILFMMVLSHNRFASYTYQKLDIPKQVTFQDSALLCVLQRSRRQYKSPGRSKF